MENHSTADAEEAPEPGESAEGAGHYDMSSALESELEAVLREAEATVVALRHELEEKRQQRRQHQEIERLEEHLANTRIRWEEIRVFFEEVMRELRGERPASSEGGESEEGRPQ